MKLNKITLLFSVLLISIHSYSQEKVIDRVIAVVGGNIVMQSELESEYTQYLTQGQSANDKTKCKVLENIMYQKLLLAQAKKDSVEVTDAQVDSELDRRMRYYITQFGSEDKFREFYGKSVDAFKEDTRDDIKNLLVAQKMQGKITEGITITPAEVKTYYNNIPTDSIPFINSEIEIGQIVKKPVINNDAKKEAKVKLEALRQRALKGEDFSSLAVLYSEDPGSSRNGGKYENIQRGQFVPEFEAVMFNLKNKEISEIFETSYGYHFMQLIERRGEVADLRHILITPKVSPIDMQKSKIYLDSIYTLLVTRKDSLSFSDAAGKYSDDEESKNSGGLIVNPQTGTTQFEMDQIGQLDPSLVFIIDKMKPGEFNKPALFTTHDAKQAYRILYLKNRTVPHKANLKDDYQKLQAAALNEKQQKIVNEWIKKKLKDTYVKIDPDFKSCVFENKWIQ